MKKTKTDNRKKISVKKVDIKPTIQVPGLCKVPVLEPIIKQNFEKLYMLLEARTYSRSKLQDTFISNLQKYFKGLGAHTSKDKYGNLYVTKGIADFYPTVVAHTDINQAKRQNVKVTEGYPWIYGFDLSKAEQAGIGADDKVGVYFAILMFDLFDNIKLFFPKDEEVGLVGTLAANKEFFSDSSMLVQLDRNSYHNDLITETNGIVVCSEEFVEAAQKLMDKYMYATSRGSCTDIGGIKKFDTVKCVAMNVSCGYINEHSSEEVISIPHLINATNFAYELLKLGVDKVWEHVSTIPVYENRYYPTSSYWRQSSLDLEKVESTSTSDYYIYVNSPGGTLKLNVKNKSDDDYIKEAYKKFEENSVREKNLMHNTYDQRFLEELNQAEIDNSLADHNCPLCWEMVEPYNSLLLHTECHTCGSTWNIPKESEENDMYF